MTPLAPATPEAIQDAAALLRGGLLVGLPTETVYGLAGDATNPEAVAHIYAAKGRPRFNPLIAHVTDTAMAAREAVLDARALALAERFWPGPLTIVAPRRAEGAVCDLACAGLASIAVRAPDHAVAQAVIAATQRPLAAPSANPSGAISPTSAAHLVDDALPGVALILDGGQCRHGLESTIVALLPDQPARLLRPGALARETLEAVIGALATSQAASHAGAVEAPGMLESHYAPRARLRLNALTAATGEALIGFGAVGGDWSLSANGDVVEAAARLYALLRAADATGVAAIAVAPIPETGLGAAINDRLKRAAAPR